MPETGVDVEVILNTDAERQSKSATMARIEPKGTATVEVGGFIPGELDETARPPSRRARSSTRRPWPTTPSTGTVTFGM